MLQKQTNRFSVMRTNVYFLRDISGVIIIQRILLNVAVGKSIGHFDCYFSRYWAINEGKLL